MNTYNDRDYGSILGIGMEVMNMRIGFVYKTSMVDFTIDDPLINGIQPDVRLNGSFAKLAWVF